jgi:hypothetical protein
MSTDREHRILVAFVTTFAGIDVRLLDPQSAFEQLASQVPDLAPGELAAAADLARAGSSEMWSLGHRIERQREHERRRNGQR